ncbi:DUF4465 domain-containing protein [Betaproteobacteria bacterium SCN1]|jgi:hypothetical protein|nr:DUF4465 domain-containing protein [Betaproteobacteria bacterium SCN1]MBN8759944.1 DUF4465 domain-containing protein [Thiobacillus sp.]ODU90917.1 MAG: PEP-CTERM domain protein [Thiobacillus sp. SCN 65-179]OJW35657.1 MAG: PEP-CTERM domain protein [Thiobacillus sp. 65-69]
MKTLSITALLAGFALSGGAAAAVSTFDDLSLAPESNFFPMATTTFTSGGATYNHTFTDWGNGCCSANWVYSNRTDTTTAGADNQFSSYAGSGAQGSSNYGLAFVDSYSGANPTVSFAGPVTVSGAYFTNTTYAALSMLEGDQFAIYPFGGSDGDRPDWFKLTIEGWDAGNALTGSVDFYLADYRFADNSLDYIVDEWTWVDLSSLGAVSSLSFSLNSSDVGQFGMNTPAYFAMDNLAVAAVPEPSQVAMFLAGLGVLGMAARRRQKTAA